VRDGARRHGVPNKIGSSTVRTAIVVLSWMFLVLLVLEQILGFLAPSAEDAAIFVGIAKDLSGIGLAICVIIFFYRSSEQAA
jgi:hypothetical protein